MTNVSKQHRVILIYGDPGNGKSYLAEQLSKKCACHLISLDNAYIEFIKERYPNFYLKALNLVIAQHYLYILKVWDRPGGESEGAELAWGDWVVSLAEEASRQYPCVAIEGFLLYPVLGVVQQKLIGKAIVKMVEVVKRQYRIDGIVRTLDEICS